MEEPKCSHFHLRAATDVSACASYDTAIQNECLKTPTFSRLETQYVTCKGDTLILGDLTA